MWEDWEQQLKDNPDVEVDRRLLWEYDMNDFSPDEYYNRLKELFINRQWIHLSVLI